MDILILEDDRNRQRIFIERLIGTNAVIVETVEAAIDLLSSQDWDYLFLDHDLGGEQMVPSGPGTGYEVAKWLAENPSRQPPNIIIHSYNPAGAQNMHGVLPNAVVSPGCWDSISVE
jgi:CheY-like chemotaxis protein